MKSIRYSSFLLTVLKRKKNEVIGHFSRKLIVFAPPSCVCAIFTDFFFNSPYSLLPFLPSILPISHSLYILWPAYYPPKTPPSPQFWFLVYINEYVCLYFARGWGQAISFKLLSCLGFLWPIQKRWHRARSFFFLSAKKKKRKTHFHSLPATCVLSCSKKSLKKSKKHWIMAVSWLWSRLISFAISSSLFF
jgi:hypothetical protein